MSRANWYYDHPPTCNCAQCTSRRINGGTKFSLKNVFRRLMNSLRGRPR